MYQVHNTHMIERLNRVQGNNEYPRLNMQDKRFEFVLYDNGKVLQVVPQADVFIVG